MFWGISASALLFLGVALGAFGAHGLKNRLDARSLETWETGVRYHLIHAVVLLVIALKWTDDRAFVWAGDFYLGGILLFSGTLYAVALGAPRKLARLAPIGGLGLLAGHLLLAWAFIRDAAASP